MYNFILENKLIFLLFITVCIIVYLYVKEKFTLIDPTEQINESLEQNAKGNVLIDNDILDGKIQLPEVAYDDPTVSNLYVNFVDEKNDNTLHKFTEGAVVFDQLGTNATWEN
jgi:prophage tail gpP-like protein